MAFDLYYRRSVDLRELPFIVGQTTRLQELDTLIKKLEFVFVSSTNNFSIQRKTFYQSDGEEIFNNCKISYKVLTCNCRYFPTNGYF